MYTSMYEPTIKPHCEVLLIIIISMFPVCMLSFSTSIGEKVAICGFPFCWDLHDVSVALFVTNIPPHLTVLSK